MHIEKLKNGEIQKTLFALTVPSMITLMINASYAIVDGIFVGRKIGTAGNAAMTVAFTLILIIISFSAAISSGTGPLISIKLGKGDKKGADKILGNGIMLSISASLVLGIIMYGFLPDILTLLGAGGNSYELASNYSKVILLGTPLFFLVFVLSSAICAEGDAKFGMISNLIGFIMNAVLNFVFIFIIGMGIEGAALGTVITQLFSVTINFARIRLFKKTVSVAACDLIPEITVLKEIIVLGIPVFIGNIVGCAIITLFNKTAKLYGGELGMAVIGVCYQIYRYASLMVYSISQGMQSLISYNFGAGNKDRVRKTLITAIKWSTIVSIIWFIILELFVQNIMGLFNTTDPQFIELGSKAMRISMIFMPLLGFQIVGSVFFQYVNKPKEATMLQIVKQVIIQAPVVIFLPLVMGLDGLWTSFIIADFMSAVITYFFIVKEYRLLKNNGNV